MSQDKVILLVEDNDDDVELTTMAFAKAKITNKLMVARDGVEAIEYLFGEGAHAGRDARDQPVVVLLDLKLPRLNGFAVLETIRARPASRTTVVVLTGSTLRDDRTRAQDLAADLFVTKPVGVEAYVQEMRRFRELALAH